MPIKSKNPREVFHKIMGEYLSGELNIGKSNKKVKSRKQAFAIALAINKKNKKRKSIKRVKRVKKSNKVGK